MDFMTATQGDLIEDIDYNLVVSQLADKRNRHDIDELDEYDDEGMGPDER